MRIAFYYVFYSFLRLLRNGYSQFFLINHDIEAFAQ